MIRVTVEMIPGGDDNLAYVLAQGVIINDDTGDKTHANYDCGFTRQATKRNREPAIWRAGRVENFPRSSLNVWSLLRRALENVKA